MTRTEPGLDGARRLFEANETLTVDRPGAGNAIGGTCQLPRKTGPVPPAP